MISYFQFRETHYCDTARTAGGSRGGAGAGGSGGGSGGGGSGGGGSGGGGSGGGGSGGGGSGGGGSGGRGGKPPKVRPPPTPTPTPPPPPTNIPKTPRPPRVSVFTTPPPQTVTVAPPTYVKPVKPPRVDVHDPSTDSGVGGSFDPFGGLLEDVFGEPTVPTYMQDPITFQPLPIPEEEEPELEEEPRVPLPEPEERSCPRNCKIIYIPADLVAFEGMCSCSMIDTYSRDPDYRVEFTTADVIPPVPEEVEEPYVYTQCIDVYRLSNGSVTTTRETVDYQTMADYVNVQHLLVRECGQNVPTEQEVRSYYGYTADIEPGEEPEEPTTDHIPPPDMEPEEEIPTVTVTPGLPTTSDFGIAGILFAGVLALPILAGLGKWK